MQKISVCIDVSEMGPAIQFYTKALDCKLVTSSDNQAELSANGLTIYLLERAGGTNPLSRGDAMRNYERHWTPVHLDITVSSLDKSVTAITQLGGTVEESQSGDWGSIAFCADPFGNGFCVMQMNA